MALVTLVTGASSGIGAALAREHARRGHRLVLVARREDRLRELEGEISRLGGQALCVRGDVAKDGDLERVVEKTLAEFGRLDVAIANAGISRDGTFEKSTLEDYRAVMETNYFGVLRTAYATLPALKKARGSFAAVGSVSGYLSLPQLGNYAASKYAVRAICESLVHELRPFGVSVTHIAPGFVESEIRRKEDRTGKTHDDPVPAWLVMRTEVAARQIADAIAARKSEIVLTGHGKAAVMLARHTPWVFDAALRVAGAAGLGKKRRA